MAIAIRRPADQVWSIEELARRGIFRAHPTGRRKLDDTEEELLRLLASSEFEAFMRLAVRRRKNILVSGPTGSGKTTWTKALIREIPSDERLITIEDAEELVLDRHPESRAPVLFQGRSRRRASHAQAAAGIVPANEAGPDTAGGTACRRSLRLSA